MQNQTRATVAIAQTNEKNRSRERVLGVVREAIDLLRFPRVRFYTPVNEIHVAATFSAQLSWWNERQQSDAAFVNALKNMVKANLLAEEATLRVKPNALFIQSESTEYFHAGHPAAQGRSVFSTRSDFCRSIFATATTFTGRCTSTCSTTE